MYGERGSKRSRLCAGKFYFARKASGDVIEGRPSCRWAHVEKQSLWKRFVSCLAIGYHWPFNDGAYILRLRKGGTWLKGTRTKVNEGR